MLRLGIPLVFGGLILWLVYRGIDMGAVDRVLRSQADYGVLALSLVFGLVANVIRGLRWHLLILPIVPKGETKPRLINSIATVLGSYTVNMCIPRAGELWRCAEYKRYERLTFSSLFGTMINDRLIDVFSLGLILGGAILLYGDFFSTFIRQVPFVWNGLHSLSNSIWIYVGVLILSLLLWLIWDYVRRHPEGKFVQILRSVVGGIGSIRQMPHRGLFLFYSLLIWLGYFGFFYTTFYAFPFTRDLPLEVGVTAFSLSSISVLIPVQGGLGPWHFVVITTLTLYGVAHVDAGAFALIVHTVQTLWITLVGLVAIIALPIINRAYGRNTSQHHSLTNS